MPGCRTSGLADPPGYNHVNAWRSSLRGDNAKSFHDALIGGPVVCGGLG